LFCFLNNFLFILKSWILVKVKGEGRCGERCVGRNWKRVRLPSHSFALLVPNRIDFACRLSVQQVMQDIERAQIKGDASEEELKALEIDVTGKIMLASWRGTRFEVVQVLREVRVYF
jgi:X-domain of DnaJ-containing